MAESKWDKYSVESDFFGLKLQSSVSSVWLGILILNPSLIFKCHIEMPDFSLKFAMNIKILPSGYNVFVFSISQTTTLNGIMQITVASLLGTMRWELCFVVHHTLIKVTYIHMRGAIASFTISQHVYLNHQERERGRQRGRESQGGR